MRRGFGGAAPNKLQFMPNGAGPADAHAGSAGEERSDETSWKLGHQLDPCRRHEL
jgi:hypothetical protein